MSAQTPLLPAPRVSTQVQRTLFELAEARVLEPGRRAGYELRLLGATVLPQRQVIATTQHGKWLFVDHVDDPTAKLYRGKIPVPRDEHNKMVNLDRHGAYLDYAWMGHQLPTEWQEGDPVPVPVPRQLREKDEKLTLWLNRAVEVFAMAAGGLLAVAASPLAIGAVAGAGFDPIVLGGVRHPEEPIVLWTLLAQWEWE
jgi:hypothetical protein